MSHDSNYIYIHICTHVYVDNSQHKQQHLHYTILTDYILMNKRTCAVEEKTTE